MNIIKRPMKLVPGSPEWFREAVGPRLLQRIDDEIQAQPVGEMNPTGARLLTVGLGLIYPTVSAVHHTVENQYGKMDTQALKNELKLLLAGEAIDVEMIEVKDE